MQRLLAICGTLLLFALPLSAQALRDDVLVVVNDNSSESIEERRSRGELAIWKSYGPISASRRPGLDFLGSDRQSWCFTPKQDLDKLLVKAGDGAQPPIFAVSFGVSTTVCNACKSAARVK